MLCQLNGKRYLPHPVAVKWKEVLTPPCGSEMERGTYPTLWQWNGKRYLTHPVSKWKEVLTPPCGSGMERGTYPTLWQ